MSTPKPPDNFVKTLLAICNEQSATIKAQQWRIHQLLKDFWFHVPFELPQVRQLEFEKARFISDIPYRMEVVRTLQYAMNDGYFVIKAIVDTLFLKYISGGLITQDFDPDDRIPVSFLIADILIGSLLQFVVTDKSPIPMGFIIIAKNKSLMRVKPLTLSRIAEDLIKNNFETPPEEIQDVLSEMCELGYIAQETDATTGEIAYRFVKDFTLSDEGKKLFNKRVKPVLEWAVEFWRSLFNIRSIDTTIPESYPHREFLAETAKRAATQGFSTAYSVMENIGNYYQMILDEKLHVP